LGDSNGYYLLVTVGHAAQDAFAPVYSNLKIGSVVEVSGIAGKTHGFLDNSPAGVTIKTIGVNVANAPYFGTVSLTDIRKIR
jgi:hypothetical protein